MSLAHIRVAKLSRTSHASAAGAPARPPRTGPVAECGASHEPLYRSVEEASESGLEVCDTCLALIRKQGRGAR
jgi:hypothetical protein